jgi:hypothetical protein
VGLGFGKGQLKLNYLPYAASDFLFSTVGEEWGFAGVVFVLALFTVFCWLGFRIARTALDPFGQYLATQSWALGARNSALGEVTRPGFSGTVIASRAKRFPADGEALLRRPRSDGLGLRACRP